MEGIKMSSEIDVLAGITADAREKLVNFINSMPVGEQTQVVKALGAKGDVSTKNSTAKAEFQARIFMLPAEIQRGLLTGNLAIVDYDIYKAVVLNTATSYDKIFRDSDSRAVGTTNLNNRKLDSGIYMLVTHVELCYGVNATLADSAWTTDIVDVVANGELTIKQGGRVILPDNFSIANFANKQNANERKGLYRLANPKWLYPQEEITASYFGTATASAANANIRLRLIGAACLAA